MTGVNHFDIEFLISLVETKPVLWDKTIIEYKDKTLTKNAWTEIYEELNSGYGELSDSQKSEFGRNVTKKWWNIRDGFIKSRKRQREALKSGSGASKVKKYVYEDHLQFLVKMSDERQNEVDVHDQVSGVDNSYDEDNKSLIKPQKRKLDQNDSNFMENSENRHFSFFKGVVQSLNYFDDEETIQFQMGVLQLIWNIKQQKIVKQEAPSLPSVSSPVPSPTQSSSYVNANQSYTFFKDSPVLPSKKTKKTDVPIEQKLPSLLSSNPIFEDSSSSSTVDSMYHNDK
ncbi:hypothetical protein FQR65_LT07622 [Abscondita terminalis]|nr:hypothetical protein FQR65_LT07622 [Abscondita terminalis]